MNALVHARLIHICRPGRLEQTISEGVFEQWLRQKRPHFRVAACNIA